MIGFNYGTAGDDGEGAGKTCRDRTKQVGKIGWNMHGRRRQSHVEQRAVDIEIESNGGRRRQKPFGAASLRRSTLYPREVVPREVVATQRFIFSQVLLHQAATI